MPNNVSFYLKTIVVPGLLAAGLTGCAGMDGLDKTPRAVLNTPAAVGAKEIESVAWPPERWWERYGDPGLDALIKQALAHSPDLRHARARMEQAAAVAELADARRWPELEANASALRKRYAEQYDADAPLAGQHATAFTIGAEALYTFDFWGRQRAALKAALGETAARSAELQAARVLLASRIASAWCELGRLLASRALAKQALAVRRQTLRLVDMRVRAGMDTELARKQAEGDVPATEREMARLDELIGLQRNALTALADLPVGALAEAAPRTASSVDAGLPPSVPSALIGHRPDVAAARWRVEAATQGMESARADFYPNVSLRVFAGLARQGLSVGLSDWLSAGSRTYGVEPAISLPIFDAGRLRAQFKGRAAEVDAAVETYNQTLLAAVRDVADQLVSLEALESQSRAQQQTLAARQAAFALARRQYEVGLTDHLSVLIAQNALLQEQQRQLDLNARAMRLGVELNRALGGGFDAMDTPTHLVGSF